MTDTQITVDGALVKAADLISTRGWVRGAYESPNGRLCALGSIRMAIFDTTDLKASPKWQDPYINLYFQVTEVLKKEIATWRVSHWNDRAVDKHEVIAGLRAAADRARTS